MTSAIEIVERKGDVRFASPKEYLRQRVADQVEKFNRAGQMAARVELVNEALCRLTQLVYEPDSDGDFANICSVTWRLLIPAPWGSAGWQVWGLRFWEAKVLRFILQSRQMSHKAGQRPPLFTYDNTARTWHANIADYDTLEAAGLWLRWSAISLKEWRQYSEQYRDGVATVRRRYRNS